MGGVAVLQPQELLNNHCRNNHAHNRHHLIPTAMKSQSGRNPNSGPTVPRSANRRKRSPPKSTPALPKEMKFTTIPLREHNTNNKSTTSKSSSDLVMGQVKILKRGEVLPPSSLSTGKVCDNSKEVIKEKKPQKVGVFTAGGLDDDLVVLSSADRLGPEPDVVPKHVRIADFYAGSAFITSPPPSSLPVPVFFKKKDDVLMDDDCSSTNYDATSDLRRLLKLDLS